MIVTLVYLYVICTVSNAVTVDYTLPAVTSDVYTYSIIVVCESCQHCTYVDLLVIHFQKI